LFGDVAGGTLNDGVFICSEEMGFWTTHPLLIFFNGQK
jgi:hypothetical protein